MSTSNRRDFLQSSLAGVAGLTIFNTDTAKAAPSERVNVAVMGIRGRGRGLAQNFASLPEAQVTYLIDVDTNLLPPLAKGIAEKQQGKEPKQVKDVREALSDKSLDALVIATPDHWHALGTVWGCQADKHVYVEKAISHNVWEGRKAVEAARKYKKAVQVGTQSRSVPHYNEAIQYLKDGKLGQVLMAKAYNSQLRRNIGKKSDTQVPAGVDYNLWLGPAPEKPFNENRFHSGWHWHWDFGSGDMGNDGVHDLDIARWGLGVNNPNSATCTGGKLFFDDDQQTPDTQYCTFTFPDSKAVLIYEQRLWSPYHQEGHENGVVFYGTEGHMIIGRSGWKVIARGNKPVPGAGGFTDTPHYQNFIDAIKSAKKKLNCDIEEGHYSSNLAHLGNIAYRVGRSLKFDPKTEQIVGDTEANALIRREYRKPFEVPEQV